MAAAPLVADFRDAPKSRSPVIVGRDIDLAAEVSP
jgi:hypothetical protein